MARKRYGRGRKGGGSAFKNGKYRFTAKRRYALQRAADISARRRKTNHAATAKKVAVLAGVAGVAYLGYRNRDTIGRKAGEWRNAVQPGRKEKTRINNAISVAPPSQTTAIPDSARLHAQNTRDEMIQRALPPHMGGPDNRIYNEDDTVDTDAMTSRSVAGVMRNARRNQRGKKTDSLKGTPGGRKNPAKANPANKPKESEYQDFVYEDDILVPVGRAGRGLPPLGNQTGVMPGRTRQGSAPSVGRNDPMYALEGMKAADERLLSGKDKPGPDPVSAPRRRQGSKPKAPTTGTNTTQDAKPPAAKPQEYGNWQNHVEDYVAEKVAGYRLDNPFMTDDEIKRYYGLPPYGTI